MNLENVKALAKIINDYGLTALEVSDGDTKIRLEQGLHSPAVLQQTEAIPVPVPPVSDTPAEASPLEVNYNHLTEIKSPLVGVFYSAPSPDQEPFVSIGKKVKKGDVLCIIETMKLMNEITAEQDGEIVDICVKNGDIVEFGQVIFKQH